MLPINTKPFLVALKFATYPLWQPLQITSCITLTVLQSKFYFYRNIFSNFFKDIRKPYNCLLKNSNFSIKISNE